MTSFKVEARVSGEVTYHDNALRFATRDEADRYGFDLAMRWLAVVDWRTVESDEPTNYAIVDGQLHRLVKADSTPLPGGIKP